MPYLSRIYLNPLRTGAQRLLRNPHAMHAAVLGGLTRQPVAERVLWRLDNPTSHRGELLVLTDSSPSWEHLVEQAGWSASEEPQTVTRSYEPLLERLAIGQEYAFRLKANPVSSTRHPIAPSAAQKERLATDARPRGVVVPHRTVAQQMQWLTDRVDSWGLELLTTETGDPQLQVRDRERLVFNKTGRGDGDRHRVILQTATYEGRVRIITPDDVRARLLQGVGRARAYGCGLITLAPLRPTG